MTLVPSVPADPSRIAAELLELGETLFDAVLDAAIAQPGTDGSEPLPEAELRTAADEFFRTLRVLLKVPESSAPDDPA